MKRFWQTVGTYAAKIALYAIQHPDEVIRIVRQLHLEKEAQP